MSVECEAAVQSICASVHGADMLQGPRLQVCQLYRDHNGGIHVELQHLVRQQISFLCLLYAQRVICLASLPPFAGAMAAVPCRPLV